MTDHRETQPQTSTLAGRVALAKANSCNPKRPAIRNWRITVFSIIAAILAIVGLRLKSLAEPGRENSNFSLTAPQVVDVFSTNNNSAIHMTAILTGEELYSPAKLALYISFTGVKVISSTSILVLSSRPASWASSLRPISARIDPGPDGIEKGVYGYLATIGTIERLRPSRQYGYQIADFDVPPFTQWDRGSFFVHLPSLGRHETPDLLTPVFMTETRHLASKSISDLVDNPELNERYLDRPNLPRRVISNPANYVAFSGPPHALYWEPRSLMTTEVLSDARPSLRNDRIDSINPGNGTLQGDDFVWEASGPLEPTLSATDIAASDSQSNYAFLAGIAFATAAAAAIALIQEIPKEIFFPGWWSRWPNRSKPTAKRKRGRKRI